MPVNSQFLAARAAERTFRLLIHARALCWLPLHRPPAAGQRRPFRTPLLPLTLRHETELTVARNAFYTGRDPRAGDVFLCLWRLHPRYPARSYERERVAGSVLSTLSSQLSALLPRLRLRRAVLRCDLPRAISLVREFIEAAEQDAAGAASDGSRTWSPVAPARCGLDNTMEYLMRAYHLAPDAIMDLPKALIHQLYRERLLSLPDGELSVFAPSDDLL